MVESLGCGLAISKGRTGDRKGRNKGGKRVRPTVAVWDSRWPTTWAIRESASYYNGEGACEEPVKTKTHQLKVRKDAGVRVSE